MGDVVKLWDWARERWPYASDVKAFDERQAAKETGIEMNQDDIDLTAEMGDVTPIRKLQPGDVLDVVIKLRLMMAQIETTSFTLYASFEDLGGPALDKEAEKARHTLELATARMASLLAAIEKTPHYAELRRETLARRKDRAGSGRSVER